MGYEAAGEGEALAPTTFEVVLVLPFFLEFLAFFYASFFLFISCFLWNLRMWYTMR